MIIQGFSFPEESEISILSLFHNNQRELVGVERRQSVSLGSHRTSLALSSLVMDCFS